MALLPEQTLLVLASASPRRRLFCEQLGLSFQVVQPALDETPRSGERPPDYVLRLAREKAAAVAASHPAALVLAADTTVVLEGELLGKPTDGDHAARTLARLSGRAHQVLTAVALAGAASADCVVTTTVEFRPLRSEEIAWYVATGEPLDKAGSYALQGIGGSLVRAVEGSVSNVIGLPLAETLELLAKVGFRLPWVGATTR